MVCLGIPTNSSSGAEEDNKNALSDDILGQIDLKESAEK